MRRRRPIRPLRRRMSGMRKPAPIPPKLREAHKLFSAGEYQKAADLYIMLADEGIKRNIPQSPNLYFRASAALTKIEKIDEAKTALVKGLTWLREKKKWGKLKRSSDFIINKLSDDNLQELVDFLQEWILVNVPDDVRESNSWLNVKSQKDHSFHLPSNCGNCGGPVNPKIVGWFDATTAVCNYCGCVIRNG